MYRLRFELEGNDFSEPIDNIYAMPVESQKLLYDMCIALMNEGRKVFIYPRNAYTIALLHNGFCVETVLTSETMGGLPVSEIKQILKLALPDRDDLPAKRAQRKACIEWLWLNYDSVSSTIEKTVIYLECNEYMETSARKIKKGYEKKFIKEKVPTEYYNDDMELSLDYNHTRTKLKEYFSQE